ncbi:MAG: DUF2961 domain-containing protein [Fibrella sp.]|nr:DUF2961 domain-containing protein [Armatimonadota bacterium]
MADPIPFTKSLRFDIEHGGTNDEPGVDYTSVAYWHQTHPKPRFPPLPRDLMPVEPQAVPKIAGMIEAESLQPTARATEGTVIVQDMSVWAGYWSGLAQLW